jgi:hypothetical protein
MASAIKADEALGSGIFTTPSGIVAFHFINSLSFFQDQKNTKDFWTFH